MNHNENYFIIRTYTKAELAHLYNPNVCLKVALQILRRWIVCNLPLLNEPNMKAIVHETACSLRNKWRPSYTI